MPDTEISNLTSATAIDGTELVPIVKSGANRKVTPQLLQTQVYTERAMDFQIALTDRNRDQYINSASPVVCTIPLNATVAFDVGDTIYVTRVGTGTATIDAVSGVTLNGVDGDSVVIPFQYLWIRLKKVGTDAWVSSIAGGGSGADVSVDDSGFQVIEGTTAQQAFASTDMALLNARTTGLLYGGALTDQGSGVIRIAAGAGAILDISTPSSPVYTPVSWPQTDLDLSLVPGVSYVYVNSSGTVTSTTTAPSHAEYRQRIYLHRVSITSGGAYSASTAIPMPIQQLAPAIWDIWDALGAIKRGLVLGPVTTNLTISVGAGEAYYPGVNFYTDPENPHEAEYSLKSPATFRHVLQDGTQGSDVTALDVGNYDVSGTLTAIPGASTRATIFTVKMFPGSGGNIRIFYGQEFYSTVDEAQAALQSGSYNPTLPTIYNSALTLGWIIAQKGATDLSDGTQVFITSNAFGLTGGSISTSGLNSLLVVNALSELTGVASTALTNLGINSQSQATWEAGVGTTESVVSPAKVAAAIAALGGGGLTNFTESQSTASPNAAVYVDALTAGGATTQVDIALIPKGTGAFLLAIPDGTTAGGDKRGANAIDLQTSRSVSNQVASGAGAFAAGVDSRAAGQYSVAIGYSCYASQANGSIAIGYDCDAIGQYGSVAIGYQCSATGTASVALGVQNVASGENSFATGSRATTRSIYGARAHASGRRTADGDRQQIYHVVSATTSSTSATTLTSNAGAASATNVMVLPNNSGAHFVARVTAYRSGGGVGSWEVCGTIERGANAASTALVGSTTIRTFGVSASLGSPVVDVVADTTRGAAVVQVTAGNTDTTYWVAKIELIQAA